MFLSSPLILHIAILKPVRHCFDYLLPENNAISAPLLPGVRVQVPFGKKQVIGILLKADFKPCIPIAKLKPATAILDAVPLLPPTIMTLCEWASRYYQYYIGEVMLGTLPGLLRQIQRDEWVYKVTIAEENSLALDLQRNPRQAALLHLLQNHSDGMTLEQIKAAGFRKPLLTALLQKGRVEANNLLKPVVHPHSDDTVLSKRRTPEVPLQLNSEQQAAVDHILAARGFKTFLLDGITGSGKTEVYLQVIAHYLAQGKQALVLVPEIGLTPQTIARFTRRFSVPIVNLHSKISHKQRLRGWLQAKSGEARIVIGTRSAIFVPFAQLGVIIVDEEHDHSFKQHSGFRYSARDLAIMRGHLEKLPILLGSATPALESLNNAKNKRYDWLKLSQRAAAAFCPTFHVLDIRNQYLEEGLAPQFLLAIKAHLAKGNQVLLFLNRRGYAPVLLCHGCGWSVKCKRCDAALTLHQNPARLMCHHCLGLYKIPTQCEGCGQGQLMSIGFGTARLEQALQKHFPDTPILRIDRDSVRRQGALEKKLAAIHTGEAKILIGTQMLAKGHHFPNVTFVGIVDIDRGLYSNDFRATEHIGQLIVQVAGRAGRAEKAGEVYLQTHHPHHPLLRCLLEQGYTEFAQALLLERQTAGWPPYSYLAVMHAQATTAQLPLNFLTTARQCLVQQRCKNLEIFGPIPALMERKAGQFRALLLLQSQQRTVLQDCLEKLLINLDLLKVGKKVRWSLDIDPIEIL